MKCLLIAALVGIASFGVAQQRDSALRAVSDTGAFTMHKSPLTATLLSAVIPGAGQFYNEDYLKIPIIWAAGGFLAYEVIWNNNQFLKYQDLYFNSPDSTIRKSPQYFGLKEQYRDDRDYYGAFLFIVYVVNILDAYVGAHLFDFPVSSTSRISSVRVAPSVSYASGVGLGLHIVFR